MTKHIVPVTSLTTNIDVSSWTGEHTIELTREGQELEVFGAFYVEGVNKLTLSITILHSAAHTKANTTLKGVATDSAQLSLSGTILIPQHANDTHSFLTERVLLLSPQAKAEAIPNLEILTDDVKCSHAATISRIPEEQLFYLMSRGVSRQQATLLIVDGFLKRGE